MRAGWFLSAALVFVTTAAVVVACGGDGGSTFDGGAGDGSFGGDEGGNGFICNPPCGAGEKCSSLMRCIPSDQCDGNSDCPTAGTICDPMSHKCVPGGGCGGSVIQGALVAPNLLVVLDRSCSMTEKVGNLTKWQIAVAAVNKMTTTFNGKIRFGLTMFPDTDNMNCLQGMIPIPVAPGTEMQIQSTLTKSLMMSDPYFPDGPCVTNIDTAIQQAAKEPAFMDMSRKSFALLLTDGAQAGCNAGGGDNGTIMTLQQMAMAGVKTFVIGFGGAVSATSLNNFAVAGGMPLMGMTKYYDAANQMQLDAALQAIASATLGCTFKLASTPPDPSQLYVFLDKVLVMRDPTHMNGWDYDAMTNTITVYGQACTDLKAGTAKVVDIVYGCPKAPRIDTDWHAQFADFPADVRWHAGCFSEGMRLAPLLPILLAAACGGTIAGENKDGEAPKQNEDCQHDAPTMSGTCGEKQVKITSNAAACGVMDPGQQSSETCARLCGFSPCSTISSDLKTIQCGDSMGCIGRRPEGLVPFESPSSVADYFATMAALEAASVDAFAVMERELAAHGAPKRLLARARRAARDERKHAKIVAKLAARFGARAKEPTVAPIGPRSLEAAALENATEGCVRETWGAVAGAWQARASDDAHVRGVMDVLSKDEIRHAELSWAVHSWAMKHLDADARGRVRDGMRNAADTLRREAAGDPASELVRTVGLPRGKEALALLAAIDERVWRLEIERGTA